jgi:diguanylate cyclase (GGDEF)-like protein/PAS domain S-box-containing protein
MTVRVLYIDDSPFDRELVRDVLEREHQGFALTEVHNRQGLERALERGGFDCVLSDLNILGFMGIEVVDLVHERYPDLPVLILTGTGSEELAVEAMKGEAADYILKKPPHIQRLPVSIEKVLDTARLRRERELFERELRLAATVFEKSHQAIAITDAERRIVAVNSAFTGMTDYTRDEVLGKNPKLLSSGRHSREFYRAMRKAIETTDYWGGEVWNRRKNGEIYPVWLGISAVRNETGKITHYVGIFSDITERKAAEEKIHYLAHHDPLTGLPNRSLVQDRLVHALARAARNRRVVALLFLDLDRFKTINDSLGHPTGDRLLQQVALRIRACVRESDTVSRQGGDEFLLVVSDLRDAAEARLIAQKILESLAEPFEIDNHSIAISFSIGISVYPDDGDDFQSLQRKADIAMYHAKDAGRNTYRFFTEQMNRDSLEKLRLEAHLRRALENREFSLHYQPQVDLATGRVIGAEALIRWHRPELGDIPPGQFIPIAEESGLIIPIGEWVLREACRQNRAWQAAGFAPMTVAVNLSALQFQRGDIVGIVVRILDETGLPPAHLELELTESLLLQNAARTMNALDQLKALGVKLSIDDFGTGYSSLAYLKRLSVDKLKIDQSFVRDLPHDPEDAAIVQAIISMAHGLSLATIAEGVETPEQASILERQGCDEAQGYFYARPLPAGDFAEFLRVPRRVRPPLGKS